MKNRYLITGSAGFIGSSLVRRLLSEDNSILGVDNINHYYSQELKKDRLNDLSLHSKKLKLTSNHYQFKELDLKDQASLDKIIEEFKPTCICHFAAQPGVRFSIDNPRDSVLDNILPTLNLLESAKKFGIRDFIFSSSSSVYGKNTQIPFQEDSSINKQISVYASSKAACESLCHTYHSLSGIRIRILRFFTVYGPWGRPDMSYFLFTKSFFEGGVINIFNKGDMFRDFTYIDDIIDGFVSAIKEPLDFEVINLGCGNPVKLEDFIKTLEEIIGLEVKKNNLPMQPGDVYKTWADITKAKRLLNYEPKTSINEGLLNFVEWYKSYYNL